MKFILHVKPSVTIHFECELSTLFIKRIEHQRFGEFIRHPSGSLPGVVGVTLTPISDVDSLHLALGLRVRQDVTVDELSAHISHPFMTAVGKDLVHVLVEEPKVVYQRLLGRIRSRQMELLA